MERLCRIYESEHHEYLPWNDTVIFSRSDGSSSSSCSRGWMSAGTSWLLFILGKVFTIQKMVVVVGLRLCSSRAEAPHVRQSCQRSPRQMTSNRESLWESHCQRFDSETPGALATGRLYHSLPLTHTFWRPAPPSPSSSATLKSTQSAHLSVSLAVSVLVANFFCWEQKKKEEGEKEQ